MKHLALIASLTLGAGLALSPIIAPAAFAVEARKAATKVGEAAPDFTLKGADGKEYKLADYKGKVVVLEWINPGCPVCRKVCEEGKVGSMMKSCKEMDADVVFLFINSTAATANDPKSSADYLAKNKIEAPALIDGDGKVGHAYGAKTTPHCFVIAKDGKLAYDGAIDNEGSKNYVVEAVKALKEGKAPEPSTTKPYGCGVKYARK
ncbi:MAG: redoxin domain-containing protein [Planctomycetes bacterium]|nr:redoxin domain-containing protein [Planctomycetota bacterium]